MNKIAKLPKNLKKEPLIDAIFEIRFTSSAPASEVFPGYLFSQLEGDKSVYPLFTAQIPKVIREANPNLCFAPVNRLEWGNFFINASDPSISISCKLPYPGWVKFQSSIIKIISILKEVNIIQSIERYSIKYTDLIPSTD